ncbi:MAG: hypothetical protein BGP09_32145 [Rhizobium sp. 60-20]|jgi:5,10-methylene-tetrahydrofolate dehydrogenase/methenyl tetrahydrofolate cyclohydrolase|nr:MAG: hypothetical protein BGP09_32145 [Rhizobium sp. 60-20]RKD72723.1 hypothetical protein BJ928_102510 [Rhizobium sp. WW_1]
MALATVIDGKKAAASVIEAVKVAAAGLEAETGVKTGLAVVIVGDDPASRNAQHRRETAGRHRAEWVERLNWFKS